MAEAPMRVNVGALTVLAGGCYAARVAGAALEFDPYAWSCHDDPYPVYRRLRDEAPLYRNERLGFWALSRYDDVLAGFRDTEHLSNAGGVSLDRSSRADPSETAS